MNFSQFQIQTRDAVFTTSYSPKCHNSARKLIRLGSISKHTQNLLLCQLKCSGSASCYRDNGERYSHEAARGHTV